MRAKEIEIGGVYLAKVSGNIVPVKVLEKMESYHHRGVGCGAWRDNWRCVNVKTGRQLMVKSPQRFRSRVVEQAEPVIAKT